MESRWQAYKFLINSKCSCWGATTAQNPISVLPANNPNAGALISMPVPAMETCHLIKYIYLPAMMGLTLCCRSRYCCPRPGMPIVYAHVTEWCFELICATMGYWIGIGIFELRKITLYCMFWKGCIFHVSLVDMLYFDAWYVDRLHCPAQFPWKNLASSLPAVWRLLVFNCNPNQSVVQLHPNHSPVPVCKWKC